MEYRNSRNDRQQRSPDGSPNYRHTRDRDVQKDRDDKRVFAERKPEDSRRIQWENDLYERQSI